jgi:hypothetical protein
MHGGSGGREGGVKWHSEAVQEFNENVQWGGGGGELVGIIVLNFFLYNRFSGRDCRDK